jgi:PiT family inorganic phosphate transporter
VLLMLALLIVFTLVLAFANGANDVSKGIATLVGSGVTNYRGAVIWGTAATFAGALAAAFLSQALVTTFSGKGIVAQPSAAASFLLSVTIGAIGWLVIATRTGLPVSTTHSIVGALVGATLMQSSASGVTWNALLTKVGAPLLFSPIVSLLLVLAVGPLIRRFRRSGDYCVCVEERAVVAPEGVTLREAFPTVVTGTAESCSTATARVSTMDVAHSISSAATSFFRGMNDTPKIVALGVAAAAAAGIATPPFYVLVAAAMAAGSLLAGFRVTETLAEKVTRMTPENGLAANLVTSLLVALASQFALPVSTTHVSSAAIVGTGVSRANVRWKIVREMLLAWIVTLPVSAVLAAIASIMAMRIG